MTNHEERERKIEIPIAPPPFLAQKLLGPHPLQLPHPRLNLQPPPGLLSPSPSPSPTQVSRSRLSSMFAPSEHTHLLLTDLTTPVLSHSHIHTPLSFLSLPWSFGLFRRCLYLQGYC
ncbi:hypothetical protein CDEST_01650 [Colletotrichum destructivum]|uniref:Uncharacterized protein n=1 Tax=Colletotrichum destructivum TaxID=34406 RepID=A0AAX4I0H2_9PEZI|nr:hypothetical protein CDEST_01650 [Colletotrichum destructivum]